MAYLVEEVRDLKYKNRYNYYNNLINHRLTFSIIKTYKE